MRGKDIDFEQVYDVRALRIIVPELRDCYTALGIVHALWQPIHGEFDDYISHPKGNFYRSLHTAVMADDGRSLEVQIRTPEMHRHAELGVPRTGDKEVGALIRRTSRKSRGCGTSIRQNMPRRVRPNRTDFLERMRAELFEDRVYAQSPRGEVVDLPKAPRRSYHHVHTDWAICRGARSTIRSCR
jgi:GTP pyrophosphokinase